VHAMVEKGLAAAAATTMLGCWSCLMGKGGQLPSWPPHGSTPLATSLGRRAIKEARIPDPRRMTLGSESKPTRSLPGR
jgi:hypothetical protein